MLYNSAQDWQNDPHKRVLLFGMAGLGKTHVSKMLRSSGDWFHYSVDYRIGTRYLGEQIVDSFKKEAMRNPFLRELLKSDSIHIGSNISFENLSPLSTYLGKPGDPAKGGRAFDEYMHRQVLHESAEIAALLDTRYFIDRARDLYQYPNFVCDSGGSICEVVDPYDPDDPVLTALSENLLLVWIEGSDAHSRMLQKRFDQTPKPMCYRQAFLTDLWQRYLSERNVLANAVDPDKFASWAFAQALVHRQPRYMSMARNWGVSVSSEDVDAATSPERFNAMIARALEKTPA